MILILTLTKLIDLVAPYFNYIVILFYLLYISLFLGINVENEKYIKPLKTFIRIFVGLFLLIHFNPYNHKTSLTKIDLNIIMSSGMVILLDAGFSSLIEDNLARFDIKNRVQDILS
tara:strand:- start:46 stop:393 length:348 start_codon:yes stop_codon:yes gene_type:complete